MRILFAAMLSAFCSVMAIGAPKDFVWFDGNEAVSLGLIDELGGLSEAMEYLKTEAKRRAQKDELT